MRARWLVAVLAALFAAGVPAAADHERQASERKENAVIAFEVLRDEVFCGLEKPLRLVVRTDEEWARLWSEIYRPFEPVPELPRVDFSREMLIVVATGMRRSGGFDIEVQRIIAHGETLEVTVREQQPPPGAMVSMTLTQPVQIVRLDRSDQEVVFIDADTTPARSR